jgi:hypothetical protein
MSDEELAALEQLIDDLEANTKVCMTVGQWEQIQCSTSLELFAGFRALKQRMRAAEARLAIAETVVEAAREYVQYHQIDSEGRSWPGPKQVGAKLFAALAALDADRAGGK